MTSPYSRWGTTHSFDALDIRSKFTEKHYERPMHRDDPDGWIVAVLLLPRQVFRHSVLLNLSEVITDAS